MLHAGVPKGTDAIGEESPLQRPHIDLEQLRRILPQDHLLAVFRQIQLLDEVEVRTHVGDRSVRALKILA